MLILSRPIATSIVIDNDIRIHVLGFDGHNGVKIGIEAPKHVAILRHELWEKNVALNAPSASLSRKPNAPQRGLLSRWRNRKTDTK